MIEIKTNPFVTSLSIQNLSTTAFPDLPSLENGDPAGMQRIIIPPNHLLTPHLHPDSNETTICLKGCGRVGIISPDTANGPIGASFQESDFNTNNVVFLPQGFPHYFRNLSAEEDLELLLTFENFHFNIITLADLFQNLPAEIVASAQDTDLMAATSPIIKYQ